MTRALSNHLLIGTYLSLFRTYAGILEWPILHIHESPNYDISICPFHISLSSVRCSALGHYLNHYWLINWTCRKSIQLNFNRITKSFYQEKAFKMLSAKYHAFCSSLGVLTFTVYPKKYAHGFCFAVLCCGYTLTDFPISIRLTSLAQWQSNDCPSASKATLMNMDTYFMWIHYERLHNHNKAKHNKTVCIFHGIYCTYFPPPTFTMASRNPMFSASWINWWHSWKCISQTFYLPSTMLTIKRN